MYGVWLVGHRDVDVDISVADGATVCDAPWLQLGDGGADGFNGGGG